MALILSIDTSLEEAGMAIAEDERLLGRRTNSSQADHAAWVHMAIRELCIESGRTLKHLDAVAVTSGPGSYTGLRVAMATAKGLCYALKIPLITETTLTLTASRVKSEADIFGYPLPVLICPMIDARRMEVFASLYDGDLNQLTRPAAVVLDETSFSAELDKNIVLFCGNGTNKWKSVCRHPNAVFLSTVHDIADLMIIAVKKFRKNKFSELAYAEPDYFKNVYTGN